MGWELVVTYCASKVHRARESGQGRASAIMHIALFVCFHVYLLNIAISGQSPFFFDTLAHNITLKLLVQLIYSTYATSSVGIAPDKQTDRRTEQVL